jgi:predicted MPP superfamily phosphohydrolase
MGGDYASKVSARRVAAVVVAAGLTLVALAAVVWSVAFEPDRLVVHRVRVPVSGLPPALDGLRIVALSDVHAGAPHVGRDKLRRVADTVNGLDPDVVVFLGDLVIHGVLGGRFIAPEVAAAELGRIRATKIAVLGNHDWRLDGRRVGRALEASGFRVLDNDVASVEHNGRRLWFAGLADMDERRADVAGTLARVPDGETVVVLSHRPDIFADLPARVGLTLAGHTHGGQVRFPLLGAPVVPSKFGARYAAGLIEERGRRLFVTSGIGTSIVPVRFGVPPEIAEITLTAAPP